MAKKYIYIIWNKLFAMFKSKVTSGKQMFFLEGTCFWKCKQGTAMCNDQNLKKN